jgi:hypothetical protein
MAFLTPQEIEKQQAEAEGYQQGPQPEINNPNANTQDKIGNPVVQTPEPAPYYPGATETPNLQMSLTNMPVNIAENFVLLDESSAAFPSVQGSLQSLNSTVSRTVSVTAPATGLYTLSLYMSAPGTAAAGHTLVGTISYTCELGPETSTVTMPLDSANIIMETYPLLVIGGTSVTLTTAYGGGATNDPYNISARIVEMP